MGAKSAKSAKSARSLRCRYTTASFSAKRDDGIDGFQTPRSDECREDTDRKKQRADQRDR